MPALNGKNVVVVGLGTSGQAAARLCLRRGANVTATDAKNEKHVGGAALALTREGATLALGGHDGVDFEDADLVVMSPGVPSFPALAKAEAAGVEVIGEVELSIRQLPPRTPIVAVGGTNGKSTVTSLVGAIFEGANKRTFTGGNLGEPLADHVDDAWDVVVLEVSSFQMERVRDFKPRVSILLNVTPDHLDRYPSFEAYAQAKGNAFGKQTGEDLAVFPANDPVCLEQARRGAGRLVSFGPGGEIDVTESVVHDTLRGARFPRALFGIQGGHNALNVGAAVAACADMGVPAEVISRVARDFRGLPHRMMLVAEHRGVRYYDDSKGTNVGAAVTALLGVAEEKAVLVAGGRDKGGSYAPLVDALRKRGRAAVLIGESADAIAKAIDGAVPVTRAKTLGDAVLAAASLARPGDAVLLSPACSSFDMFRDYKHRGEEFVRAVRALAGDRKEGE